MSMLWYLISFIISFVSYAVFFIIRTYILDRRMGLKGPFPYPFVGNLPLMFKMGIADFDKFMISKYGQVCRYYEGHKLVILVTDPFLTREILVKKASNFRNRQVVKAFNVFPLSKGLPALCDEEWNRVRQTVARFFTPSYIMQMVPLMEECTRIMLTKIAQFKATGEPCKMEDIFKTFSANVITSCLFGVKISENSAPNPIIQNMEEMVNIKYKEIKYAAAAMFPWLLTLTRTEILRKDCVKFLSRAMKEIIENRKQCIEERPDLLQFLISLEKESFTDEECNVEGGVSKTLSEDEMLGQVVTFFIAGYFTMYTAMAFFCYNMALHPEYQKKLQESIDEVLAQDADITYENISSMKYLDACLSETIRMNPPSIRLDRVNREGVSLNGVYFPKNTLVIVPATAINYNPAVFPEPDKFNPERPVYNDDNFMCSFQFLPFGAGPRFCIGKRFATFAMKLALVHLFKDFDLKKCPLTQIPLRLKAGTINKSKDGIFLEVVNR